jgi:phosphoglycolate phosphatase
VTFIYDLDGTLFNTKAGNRDFYEDLYGPMSDEQAQFCFTHSMPISIQFLFGKDAPAIMERVGHVGIQKMVDGAVPEHKALETVKALKAAGHKVALNSNRTTAVKCLLDRWECAGLFDMVVTSLEVERPKPDPEGAYRIMSVLGNDAVYIGDSDIDRQTAHASGLPFLHYGVDFKDHREVLRYARV